MRPSEAGKPSPLALRPTSPEFHAEIVKGRRVCYDDSKPWMNAQVMSDNIKLIELVNKAYNTSVHVPTRAHTHTLRNTHTQAHTHTRTQACLYSTYVYDCMWVCGCVPLSLYGIISELRNAARMQLPFDWGKGARHTLDPAAMAWLFGKSCSSSWKLLATFCSQVMQKHCKASTWMQSNFTMLWYLHKPCFCSAFNMKSRHL